MRPITIAKNLGTSISAGNAYQEARKNRVLDKITCNAYLDALIKFGELEQAKAVFLEFYPVYGGQQKLEYDFHGFGYGAAYIACTVLSQKAKPSQPITLIVGKGVHSKGKHVVKKAVKDFVESTSGGVSMQEDLEHGKIILVRHPFVTYLLKPPC